MNLIAAVDKNWAIGRAGRPLVTIPACQQAFLKETAGKVVVMGRKTFEALPGSQPLSRRLNVVLSRDEAFSPKGTAVCRSLEEAIAFLGRYPSEDIYIIGGESIFRQFLPYCSRAYITALDYVYDADASLPNLDKDPQWLMTREGEEQTCFNLCYCECRYERQLL